LENLSKFIQNPARVFPRRIGSVKLVEYFDLVAAISALVDFYVVVVLVVLVANDLILVGLGKYNLSNDYSAAILAVLTSGKTVLVAVSSLCCVLNDVLVLLANVAFELLNDLLFATYATYMVYSGSILVYEILTPGVSLGGGSILVDLAVLIARTGELADTGSAAGSCNQNGFDIILVVLRVLITVKYLGVGCTTDLTMHKR
jgi:hypothetical protein